MDLWLLLEAKVEAQLGPPFWGHAWPGGLGLARYVLDHPEAVRGRRVLDFASGCGVSAVAAAKAGALHVLATEVDAFAVAATRLNAEVNGAQVEVVRRDVIGAPTDAAIALIGDVFYERELTAKVSAWMEQLVGAGVTVWVGDPGRSFLPRARLLELAAYPSERSRTWDSCDASSTRVFEFR